MNSKAGLETPYGTSAYPSIKTFKLHTSALSDELCYANARI